MEPTWAVSMYETFYHIKLQFHKYLLAQKNAGDWFENVNDMRVGGTISFFREGEG